MAIGPVRLLEIIQMLCFKSSKQCRWEEVEVIRNFLWRSGQIAAEQELIADLANLSGIEKVNSLGDGKASVTIASGGGGFIKPLRTIGVVPRTPFDVIDGWADWTIQCSSQEAKDLVKEIEQEKSPNETQVDKIESG